MMRTAPDQVEREVAFDLVRRGVLIAPVLVAASAAFAGWAGAASAGFAVALVVTNFALSAAILAWAAKVGPEVLMASALGGYALRFGLMTAAVIAVHDQSWVAMLPLGLTLIVTHLGLLFWETRYVSMTLAYPGLKPRRGV